MSFSLIERYTNIRLLYFTLLSSRVASRRRCELDNYSEHVHFPNCPSATLLANRIKVGRWRHDMHRVKGGSGRDERLLVYCSRLTQTVADPIHTDRRAETIDDVVALASAVWSGYYTQKRINSLTCERYSGVPGAPICIFYIVVLQYDNLIVPLFIDDAYCISDHYQWTRQSTGSDVCVCVSVCTENRFWLFNEIFGMMVLHIGYI